MIDVVLEVFGLESHGADDGSGFGGRCDFIGLESLVDEARGFDVGLAFGGILGIAAGGALGGDVEEGTRSSLLESIKRCRDGCRDQGSKGENCDE